MRPFLKGCLILFFYSCRCVCFLNTPNMTFHIICKLRNFGLAFKNLKILLEKGERNRGDPVMCQLQPLYSPIILCTILPTGNASELKTLTWVCFFTSITQNELGVQCPNTTRTMHPLHLLVLLSHKESASCEITETNKFEQYPLVLADMEQVSACLHIHHKCLLLSYLLTTKASNFGGHTIFTSHCNSISTVILIPSVLLLHINMQQLISQ